MKYSAGMELRGCQLDHIAQTFAGDAIVYRDVHRHLPTYDADVNWDDVAANLGQSMRSGQHDQRSSQLAIATIAACSWSLGEWDEPIDESTAAKMWGERHLWALLTQRSIRGLRPSEGYTWGWLTVTEIDRMMTWMRGRSRTDSRFEGLDNALRKAAAHRCDLLTCSQSLPQDVAQAA